MTNGYVGRNIDEIDVNHRGFGVGQINFEGRMLLAGENIAPNT